MLSYLNKKTKKSCLKNVKEVEIKKIIRETRIGVNIKKVQIKNSFINLEIESKVKKAETELRVKRQIVEIKNTNTKGNRNFQNIIIERQTSKVDYL
jgi:hypothetical protein